MSLTKKKVATWPSYIHARGLSLLLLLAGVKGGEHHRGGLFIIFPFDRPEMNCAGQAGAVLISGPLS